MSKYLISVVTPYYNVDNDMFDNCAQSMFAQSIGFENIEWIIVLHNSDKAHVDHVRSKLDGYENVVLKELYNNCRTASSPRNAGIDLATSKYISFLDGDDMLRPKILEQVLSYFEKTQAEIVVFRREYNLESPDIVPVSETALWDATREVIVLDMKNGVDNRVYNDFPFFVTNRVFNLKFLNENNIRFDDDIFLAEDCYFNLKTIHAAEKMCILPQLIGYSYFVNSKSILNSEKSDDEVIQMMENAQKIIESALDYGLYANNIIIPLSFALSRYLTSPKLKMETRIRVRDTMQPYLDMTTPIPEGRFAEPLNTMMNVLPREILLNIKHFEDVSGNIALNGTEVLAKILKENEETHFGKRYHFSDILTPRGYQAQVPISSVKAYQAMINVEKNIDDTNIYLKERPSWYLRMINDMLLPVSKNQAESYADAFYGELRGDYVFVWSEDDTPVVPSNNGVYVSSICNISMSEYRRKYRVNLEECARQFAIPFEIIYNMDTCSDPDAKYLIDRIYLKLLLAVSNRKVNQIILFDSYDLVSLQENITVHFKELISDIEAGKLLSGREYHEAYTRMLETRLHSDPERAAELRELLERPEGFTLKDIWKDLSEITIIGVKFATDEDREFEGIRVTHRLIVSEFGVIGTSTCDDGVYILNRKSIFYEFRPINVPKDEKPVLSESLRLGDIVTPIITTDSGLYRVPLTFNIEITGIENGDILFKPAI